MQLGRALAEQRTQILQVVARGDAKLPDKVLCRTFQIAIVFWRLVFGTAEICVRGDGLRALEALQARLCFLLLRGVKGGAAEELVG